jgi:serine protease Do
MNPYVKIPSLVVMTTTIALVQADLIRALSPVQISAIAEEITVLIDGQNPGSGVIIGKKNKIYYVLTAKHVVETQDEYTIKTPDGKTYPLNYSTVKKLPNVDLAVIQFSSDKNYRIAQLGNSDQAKAGASVYIYGFPNPGREIRQRIPQFTTGQVSSRPQPALRDGYNLVYTNVTRAGMSGGPVLDENGRLVGIHGRAEAEASGWYEGNESGESISKIGFNLGIPINVFLELAPKAGVDLAFKSDNSQPTPPPPTTNIQPTPTPITTPTTPASPPSRPSVVRPKPTGSPVCAGRTCN